MAGAMSQHVLLVGDAPRGFEAQCRALPRVACAAAPWDDALRERLSREQFDLAVAFAPADVAGGRALFHWLAEHPIARPMLAVLQPDGELLCAAARVVDDFAIAPVRDDELRF